MATLKNTDVVLTFGYFGLLVTSCAALVLKRDNFQIAQKHFFFTFKYKTPHRPVSYRRATASRIGVQGVEAG
jgi:hypothetical protein